MGVVLLFRQIFIVDNGQNIEEIIQPIGHTASVVIFGPPFMKPIEAEFTSIVMLQRCQTCAD